MGKHSKRGENIGKTEENIAKKTGENIGKTEENIAKKTGENIGNHRKIGET